jgi:replicative DNA helicase
MDRNLLLDVQRRVIGGYINAEEFSVNGSAEKILSIELDEALFDNFIHKAVVRACRKLREIEFPITEYTVLEFLQKHNLPKGAAQESEYLHLQASRAITPESFSAYISMILKHKMEN